MQFKAIKDNQSSLTSLEPVKSAAVPFAVKGRPRLPYNRLRLVKEYELAAASISTPVQTAQSIRTKIRLELA